MTTATKSKYRKNLVIDPAIVADTYEQFDELPVAAFFRPVVKLVSQICKFFPNTRYKRRGGYSSYNHGWRCDGKVCTEPGCLFRHTIRCVYGHYVMLEDVLRSADSHSIQDDIAYVMVVLADAVQFADPIRWVSQESPRAATPVREIVWLRTAQHLHDAGYPWGFIPRGADRFVSLVSYDKTKGGYLP